MGLAVLVTWLLVRTRRGADAVAMAGWATLALLLATAWLVPWYIAWLLPLACWGAFMVVNGEMERLFNILVRYAKPNLVGKAFGIITMRIDGRVYDFAFPRTENKTGPRSGESRREVP